MVWKIFYIYMCVHAIRDFFLRIYNLNDWILNSSLFECTSRADRNPVKTGGGRRQSGTRIAGNRLCCYRKSSGLTSLAFYIITCVRVTLWRNQRCLITFILFSSFKRMFLQISIFLTTIINGHDVCRKWRVVL